MLKHRVTLTEEEIEILLEALDSADFYSDDDEFYTKLEKLRDRLRKACDISLYLKRRKAGRISARRREYYKEYYDRFSEI